MKKNITIILISIICVLIIALIARTTPGKNKSPVSDTPIQATIDIPKIITTTKTHTIEPGETLNGILQREAGLASETAFKTIAQIQDFFDVTSIRSGDTMEFTFTDDQFSHITFDVNAEEQLIISYVEGVVEVERKPIEYEIRQASASVVISSSLYLDGTEAGMTDRAILDLAQIFSWDVDFATSIQEGDSFTVFYQNRYRDGAFVGVGDLLAARFTNAGEDHYAFLVRNGEDKKYFDENGNAKERLLLKTPLNYSRVSSQFSTSRKHPVLGTMRAHKGTDFAAPTGTPVESVGDGVVTLATTQNGYGKIIRIKHGGGYETAYAHLSSILVNKGDRVTQGEIIGKVGSTGLSTGPHLHYEVLTNGVHVDPLRVDLPDGDPLDDALLPIFEGMKNEFFDKL